MLKPYKEVYSMKNKTNNFTAETAKCTSNLSLYENPFHILFNEKQAAAYLGLTDRAMQQRRYASLPPCYIKLPGSTAVRYRLSILMEFVAEGEVPLN